MLNQVDEQVHQPRPNVVDRRSTGHPIQVRLDEPVVEPESRTRRRGLHASPAAYRCACPVRVRRFRVVARPRHARGPEQAALHDLPRFRHVEVGRHVADGEVEDAALAVELLPRHRHHDAVDPRRVLARERRRREHLDVRVDEHVVLLGVHPEVGEAFRDRIVALRDVHGVVDDAARVGRPRAAHHELVLGVVAEGVAQPAVPAGQAHAAADGVEQPLLLLGRDRAHRARPGPRARGSSSSRRRGTNRACWRSRRRTPARRATGAKTSTVCFGSWPAQPPHTISTFFLARLCLGRGRAARGGTRAPPRATTSSERRASETPMASVCHGVDDPPP